LCEWAVVKNRSEEGGLFERIFFFAEMDSEPVSPVSGPGPSPLPPVLLHGPAAFRRAILFYMVSVVGVAPAAKAATMTIGLPTWVLPGALVVMALGLPVILFTGYVRSVAWRVLVSTPALTPGGGHVPHSTMATLALKANAGRFAQMPSLPVSVPGFEAFGLADYGAQVWKRIEVQLPRRRWWIAWTSPAPWLRW
jgi:hypothetical protein